MEDNWGAFVSTALGLGHLLIQLSWTFHWNACRVPGHR